MKEKSIALISRSTTQGHIAFIYDNPSERLKILAVYFEEGLKRNELCVFVTSYPPDQVLSNFRNLGYNFLQAIRNGSLRIFEMYQTYLQDGKFVSDFMAKNVLNFLDDAKNLGFTGLRTAGEMSWLNEHLEAVTEADRYEIDINQVCESNENFIGLCLYPAKTTFGLMLSSVMHSHPNYIYEGEVHPS
jgi:hypothetical protein